MDEDMTSRFDVVLALANSAQTQEARDILADVRRVIAAGDDVAEWARAVQLARDLGAMDQDGAFFFLGVLSEETLLQRIDGDSSLAELTEAMVAIERREGLTEDEAFLLSDAPSDWEALNRRWEARARAIQAEFLRAVAEPEMATELQLRTTAYDARSRRGWRALLAIDGEPDPFANLADDLAP